MTETSRRIETNQQTTAGSPDRLPLTAAQLGIWYAQQLDPENPSYQIGQYLDLRGQVDERLLRIAFTKTVADLDAMSLVLAEDSDGPYAVIERPSPTADLLTTSDLRRLGEEEAVRVARERMDLELETPRSMTGGDLLGTTLYRVAEERWLLFQRVHHVLLDGYSAVVGLRYLAGAYSRLEKSAPRGVLGTLLSGPIAHLAARTASPLPGLRELHEHLDEYASSEKHEADADYWRAQLADDSVVTGLEGTTGRAAKRVVRVSTSIPDADAARLRALGRDLPKTAVGLVALYLSKMTGQARVSLGLPVTARRGKVAKTTPSMLSSILPLRVDVSAGLSLSEVIANAGDAVRGAVAHQQFRVEEVAQTHALAGPSVNLLPVIDELVFGRARGTVNILSTGPVHDLSVVISGLTSEAAAPTLQLEGDAELYTSDVLREHAWRMLELLSQVLDEPATTTVTDANVVRADEIAGLLEQGSGDDVPIGQESVLRAFSKVAAVRDAETAVVAADGTLTFAELDALSTRLAHHLVGEGVGAGRTVAVRIERSRHLPVLVLAVLKAGGVYVPLDPEYPIDRVGNMIEDAQPALLLTSKAQEQRDLAAGAQWRVATLPIDADTSVAWRRKTADPSGLPTVAPSELAYVVFTSGSTGRPKGVGVDRLALRNLFEHHRAEIFDPAAERLGRPARVAHTAGLSFDAAWDPLLWLFAGHELHMIDDDVRRDPQRLAAYFAEHGIDAIETTPSFAEALIAGGLFDQDRYPTEIALGGEAVGPALWDALAAQHDVRALNLYGPTETTVDSLIAPIESGSEPHIGTSVRNTRHYLLDASLTPVPDGAIGELYLAGANVASGYVGQPGLSAERFLADPFAGDGTRMYRTGDVVRRRRSGSLRFLGRIDEQIKIRGYRVELAEVEAALRRQPGVSAAAAIVVGEGASARLVGYVTGDSEITDLAARTRASLATELPGYMVPGSVLALSELPMTPNGKLDRRALPAPDQAPSDPVQQPRTRAERVTAEAFADVLGITSIGVDEDFFAAGGHSLLATKLASKLSERLERQVTVRDVFERPTVAGLASLDAEDADAARALPLVPTPHSDELPVSLAQRRLWFLNSLEPGSSAYNIPVVLHLDGELDVAALRWAFRDVAELHEPLRTVFPYIDGEPRQRILPIDEGAPSFTAVEVPADRVDEIVRQESLRPFDVTVEVPLRAVLLRRSATSHVLVATMHHIASDGWSLAPFAADLSAAYTARTAPESAGSSAAPSPALPVSYADYTLWQRESLGSEEDSTSAMSTQLDFWRRALAGAPDEIDLPRDRERGSRPSDIGHLAFELDAERHLALRRVASEHRTSLFIVLHAAVAAALGQHGAGTDIVLGTPVAGRVDPKLERLVGFFVNTVALRTSLVGNPTLAELIERVRAGNTDAYAHQDVPFDAVVDAVRPPRVADRHPVFQVLLTLQNTEPARLDLGDVEVTVPGQVTTAGVKTDLMLDFSTPAGDEGPLEAALAYDLALFDESTIERMRDTVDRMLAAMVETIDRSLSEIPAVDAATRHRIDTQARGRSLTVEGTVLDVLAASICRAPQASALEDEHENLSFAELGARVDAAALGLVASGVRPGDRVAVALARSGDAVTLVLAALRSGAIAVPIDIDYPDARVAQILEASTPAMLIASDADRLTALAADSGTPATAPAALVALGESAEDTSLPELPRPEQPAYLVFTSGTTGTPKGVQVPHSALANVQAQHEDAMIAPLRSRLDGRAPRVLHVAGLGFDAAWDPILWLAAGSALVMATDGTRRSADELVQRVDDAAIDVLETTPSYVRQLISTGLLDRAAHRETPLLIALGGEAVSRELWDSLLTAHGVDAWNLYGPSEFAVDSVVTRISEPGHVRIGRPVANVTARVLDTFLRDVPDGVPGELHLAGASEAHGYRGRAAETATAFIADPSGDGTRLYRTGDIVRRHGSGELEFLRRDDDQIKLRGYRIELGDVERSLERTAGVDAAVATIHAPAGQDSARLVAWVAGTADGQSVTAHARAALPDYMVPSSVTVLERLPLTPNGKVDLAALPAPESAAGSRRPQTEDERAICAAFAAVIGLDEVGLDDDFFRLGGHSLLAVALAGELRTRFGTAPALRAIFDAPTPAGLLALLGRTGERTEGAHMVVSSTRPPLRAWTAANPRVAGQPLPLSPGQARLWFLNRLAPSSGDYNVVLSARLDGELDREALVGALDDLVARHEVLRTSYPEADGAPVQRIHAPVSGLLQSEPVDASAGFDLTRDLPFRAGLSELGDGSWLLQLVIHHIATDGASLAPLAHDLATAYTARRSGSAALRRPLPAQFADFARLLTAHEDEAREARELTDWTDFLDGAPSVLELSADGAREAGSAQPARQLAFTVPANVATGLGSVAAGTSASGFHGWLGALAGFLMRTGSGTDLVIGAPSAGRQDADLSDLIGFFVNTLPLRIQLGEDATLAGAVEAARASALFGIDHEQVPFERIVEAVAPERVLGRHPLFQTMLAVEEQSDLPLALPGVDVSPVAPESTGGAKFDLSFTLRPAEAGSDVPGVLEYNSALFSEAAAKGLVERLLAFLTVATETPDAPLASITIPGTPERLPAWRPDGDVAADADLRSVLEAFDAAAERTPDAPAVVAPDGAVDFRTLAERVEQVSLALRRGGVKRGGVVAYRLPRSVDTVAALLGIWRAGAVAMPIDPEYPSERVDAMLDAARPALVIDGGLDEILAEGAGAGGEAGKTGGSEVRTAQLDAPAYLIFTSGTTGVPKGVQVPHRALASLLRSHRSTLLPDAAERRIRVAHTTGVGFDAAMDPILWLASGHELHVVADDVRRDPEALVQLFADRQIRAWETTPSYVEALTAQTGLEHWLDSLSAADSFTLLLGGEAISGELWTWLRRRTSTRAWNLYGPTEVGVDSMLASIEDTKEPTLGSTTRDVVGHVLDARLRPAPAGSIGELWLSGPQLADGYTGRSAATAERFVADPFARDGSRMYRTGDLVVVRDAMPDEPSRVVSLGRTDAQLKIRGHRVEPEELTRVIAEQPGVASAVVLPVESAGQTVLGAWIVPSELPAESDDTAREQLADQVLAAVRGRVPDYMHPVGIRVITRVPLTPNGKLDRDALPEHQASGGTGRAPSTRAELAVAAAFAETLGIDDVRADDSFFALGGHSFVAQPTIRAVNDALGTELPVQAIFQAPSVEGLAALASDGGGDIAESLRMILPLRPARDADGPTAGQEPLFAVHPASGISWKFAGLLAHLEGSRPLYGLQLPGIAPDVDHEFEHSSLEELLDEYVKAMKSVQPEGPYRIIGWSFGGRLAQHLAAHLQRGGDEVELLAIIDAYPTEHSSVAGVDGGDRMWRAFLDANEVAAPAGELDAEAVRAVLAEAGNPLADIPARSIDRMVRGFLRVGALLDTTPIPTFEGALHVFEARVDVPADRPTPQAWAAHATGRVTSSGVQARHSALLDDASLRVIAPVIDTLMSDSHAPLANR
ncbi:non-ribosomal peptide synthetase [Pseudoclavibacter sp. RFBG4]|uniref:non-ribosomal peptide synthetase n=1 Tax=Pseudoclavibacter sp. RFBG4 TaxID=2080575 RepID=UPI000CE7B3EF|nr:non-ribosomal peptide synthetase [Pseudoclavibacter sp. RFBG4]PPG32448.1 non-ribosomal peptide synthetase [Pseudoclavibacter sp. RFBG4]